MTITPEKLRTVADATANIEARQAIHQAADALEHALADVQRLKASPARRISETRFDRLLAERDEL